MIKFVRKRVIKEFLLEVFKKQHERRSDESQSMEDKERKLSNRHIYK